jgi:hypothetical protein
VIKKVKKLKNYNQPDPSFDYLLKMNAGGPSKPKGGVKPKSKKPTSVKGSSKHPKKVNTSFKNVNKSTFSTK